MPRLDQDFLTKKKVPELKTQARRKNIKPLPTKKADLIAALLGVDYAADQQWFIQANGALPRVPAVAAAAPARVQAPRAPVAGKPKYNKSFFSKKAVAELRAQCTLRGLSAVGNKPVLVDRLFAYNYLQHNQQFGVARPAQVPVPRPAQGGGQAPRPAQGQAPRPQVPAPQLPAPQVPRAPQVPAPQVPRAQVPRPQVPRPQVPRPQVPRAPQGGQVRTQEQIRKAIRDCLSA